MLAAAGKLCLILAVPEDEPMRQASSLSGRRAQMEAYIAQNGAAVFSLKGNVGEAQGDIRHAVGFKGFGGAGVDAYRTPVTKRVLLLGKR